MSDESNRRISQPPLPPHYRGCGSASPSLNDRPLFKRTSSSPGEHSRPVEQPRRAKWRDWRDWRALPLWKAILLASGKEPDDRFAPELGFGARRDRLPPRYVARLECACNHIEAGELSTKSWVENTPYCDVWLTDFAVWWEERGWQLPTLFPRGDQPMRKSSKTAALPAASPRRIGRPEGSGSYSAADAPLVLEMHQMRLPDPDMSITAAAKSVAHKAKGASDDSKVARLVKRYKEKFPDEIR